jgi:penicillin-binding protein 1A
MLPEGSGGNVEWVKAEDLERMETYVDYGPQDAAAPSEEAFDIF